MYSLKGIFPEPKREQKKNFIKENMKQLKFVKRKVEPRYNLKMIPAPESTTMTTFDNLNQINLSETPKSNLGKKQKECQIKKGDMSEFLKRKELRQSVSKSKIAPIQQDDDHLEFYGFLRDIGCQTQESTVTKEPMKLTMLYQKQDDVDGKQKGSGDSEMFPPNNTQDRPDLGLFESERRARLNSILEKKDNKDPYLPAGYQKGVVPKYIRSRKEQGAKTAAAGAARADDDEAAECPPGHVALPDNERKETLKMLRSSFAELVNELNKMPVKTDTLKMRNRKMELEKQLTKLEDGIKVFSKAKVFVKIGE